MTNEERVRAFCMRLNGDTWIQIGTVLHYDPNTVQRDLRQCMEKPPRPPTIIYPQLHEFVQAACCGSIETFAGRMKVSPYRLRRVLVHGDRPSESLVQKILNETGLTKEEAFSRAVHL